MKAFAIFTALAIAGGTAQAQPTLSYLQAPLADSPIAWACIVGGAPTSCEVSIVPFCEKHQATIMPVPSLAQTCIRAERAAAQAVHCVPPLLPTGRPICEQRP